MSGYNIKTLKRADQAVAIEHMDAMSVVMAARQSSTLASTLDLVARAHWVERFAKLREELDVAIIAMQKTRPELEPPPFLLAGTPAPEFDTRYLKPAADALVHD